MQIANLEKFLLVNSLISEPNKLQMDLTKLLEKSEFMKLVKENVSKKESENEH